jgi:D-alanine-D-alanine ligase
MRVAVLGGGRSSEREISLASAKAVHTGLTEAGHESLFVTLELDGRWTHAGRVVSLTPGERPLEADVVFPALHGPLGEDGTVQGLLELCDVPYVGAGVLSSAVCMDKAMFKELVAGAGISQVEHLVLGEGDDRAPAERLEPPLFVKPARLGSSIGVSKIASRDELPGALEAAFRHGPVAVVEAMSRGVEVECAVLGNGSPWASQPGETVLDADWCDYETKYDAHGWELVVPARLPVAVRERIRGLATEVFALVRCTGLARVDFFVEDGGRVLVNEVNTMPGFTRASVFPRLLEVSGVAYPELLDRLLGLALERHERGSPGLRP